jgi:hypothetical protein
MTESCCPGRMGEPKIAAIITFTHERIRAIISLVRQWRKLIHTGFTRETASLMAARCYFADGVDFSSLRIAVTIDPDLSG